MAFHTLILKTTKNMGTEAELKFSLLCAPPRLHVHLSSYEKLFFYGKEMFHVYTYSKVQFTFTVLIQTVLIRTML